jgi:microcystin-dependent protein
MSEPYIGEIRLLPYTFAPKDWAYCNGQLMDISQHTPLYAVIGNNYGGDGRTTFALPNLQGRIAMGVGQGPGTSYHPLAQMTGSATANLSPEQLPAHNHEVVCDTNGGTTNSPKGAFIGKDRKSKIYQDDPTSFVPMAAEQLQSSGGGEPHANIQPFIVVNYCICIEGLFPPRS